jgi:hypothetical protein
VQVVHLPSTTSASTLSPLLFTSFLLSFITPGGLHRTAFLSSVLTGQPRQTIQKHYVILWICQPLRYWQKINWNTQHAHLVRPTECPYSPYFPNDVFRGFRNFILCN